MTILIIRKTVNFSIWHLQIKFKGYFCEKNFRKSVIDTPVIAVKRTISAFQGNHFIMSFMLKSLLIVILASSIASQKCKKPKVAKQRLFMISLNSQIFMILKGESRRLLPRRHVPMPRVCLHCCIKKGCSLDQIPCFVRLQKKQLEKLEAAKAA